ncbi:MAG: hypothetical protein WAQ98_18530 [Blastocatellia bacterium]
MNNSNNNSKYNNEYRSNQSSQLINNKGFSLFEVVIAIILGISVMAVLMTLTLGGVKNNRFALTLSDMSTLTEQKASDIFRDIPKQIKNMPNGVNTLGSLNPEQPVNDYFDLLNDSGCVLKTGYQLESDNRTAKGDLSLGGSGKGGLGGGTGTGDDGNAIGGGKGGLGTGGTRGGNDGGDKGDDGSGGIGAITGLDCSRATFGVPTSSLIPRYRRQWVVVKNKPNIGDTTVGIVLVDLVSNSILRSELITKIDGKYSITN